MINNPSLIFTIIRCNNKTDERDSDPQPIKLVDTEKLKPNNNNNTGIVSHIIMKVSTIKITIFFCPILVNSITNLAIKPSHTYFAGPIVSILSTEV